MFSEKLGLTFLVVFLNPSSELSPACKSSITSLDQSGCLYSRLEVPLNSEHSDVSLYVDYRSGLLIALLFCFTIHFAWLGGVLNLLEHFIERRYDTGVALRLLLFKFSHELSWAIL